ncbi:MAG TPA: hypothetical protein VKR58_06280 [Aquella sp.]|nr:hypothetical protein [Aquella sp.]
MFNQVTPEQFHKAITAAKRLLKYGAAVHIYSLEEYAEMQLYLTIDNCIGYALKNGDIVSVFKHPITKVKASDLVLPHAIENGGNHLDCFDCGLPEIYKKFGFREVSRFKWDDKYAPEDWNKETFTKYNNGEPDVVFMSYAPLFQGE